AGRGTAPVLSGSVSGGVTVMFAIYCSPRWSRAKACPPYRNRAHSLTIWLRPRSAAGFIPLLQRTSRGSRTILQIFTVPRLKDWTRFTPGMSHRRYVRHTAAPTTIEVWGNPSLRLSEIKRQEPVRNQEERMPETPDQKPAPEPAKALKSTLNLPQTAF